MDATFSSTPRAVSRSARNTPWELVRSGCSAVFGVLAHGARNESLDRFLTTSSSAQFAALPRTQQSRHLDRGFGPRG